MTPVAVSQKYMVRLSGLQQTVLAIMMPVSCRLIVMSGSSRKRLPALSMMAIGEVSGARLFCIVPNQNRPRASVPPSLDRL
jgi:hypothetical protein